MATPKLDYDNADLTHVLDDEGNAYTPDQVRAASAKMVQDESGQGSMGGLTEDDTGSHLTTAPKEAPSPTDRELNPAHTGKFIHDNLFGGFGSGYVTGKRPETLYDLGTDFMAAQYGGQDLGKRNQAIRHADAEDTKNVREADLAGERIKTSQAARQKTQLETDKLAGDSIQRMMHDLDSDLWAGELKNLQKEHGITVRPGVVSMVERMATKLSEAGATHPADVLENPDKFAPELVNRVRHTMTLLNKDVGESQAKQQEIEKNQQALGLRQGPEQRKQEAYNESSVGEQDAIDQIAKLDLPADERTGMVNAIRGGGKPRDAVLTRLAGIKGTAGRGREYEGMLQQAEEELRKGGNQNPSPGEINAKAQELKIGYSGARKQKVDVTTQAQKGLTATTQAFNQLATIENAVKRVGLTSSALGAWTTQPLEMYLRSAGKDTALAAMDSIDAVMGQIARSVSGEVGVLTNPDIERIKAAVKPHLGVGGDTAQTYAARLNFVKEMLTRAKMAHQKALETGQYQPVDSADISFPGDPFPPEKGAAPQGGAPQGDAKAAADHVRSLPKGSPERKAALAKYMQDFPGGQ